MANNAIGESQAIDDPDYVPEAETVGNEQKIGIDNVIKMVNEAGVEVLTVEELETYSSYMDENFTSTDKNDHNANLVEHIKEEDLSWINGLAKDVCEWVDTDLTSRKEWMERERKGIISLGVSNTTLGGADFVGASRVTHPLIIEACTQFQARAISEMWPAQGPVKTVVVGETDDDRRQQAQRVQDYMNYQYTQLMPGGFEEEDKLLFRLPISGSCFKKSAYDPMVSTVVSKFVESSEFIVPYSASDLESAIRFTEKYEETGNDTNKKISAGIYANTKLNRPDTGPSDKTTVELEIDNTEGRSYVEYQGDHPYTRYECYCTLNVPGFEDVDIKGEKTYVNLPYVVTVDKDNQQVLAIRRNWKAGDIKKKRRVFYTHYRFLPGLGFYGYGLIHAIGGLGEAATGAMRSLLDAAGLANTKGGFRSRDARMKGGNTPIGMGEWREVDATNEELKKTFFALPYDEPSKTLIELLGMIDDLGRRFASTTENMVGDANNNGPVGTTLALIEQGSKVFSAIHLRLHHSHAHEFKVVASLDSEFLPQEYPYRIAGADRFVMASDFDDRVDVIPVSDPNIISNTQRITQAQSVMTLADTHPDLYDMRKVNLDMLEAMRVQDIDALMPPPEDIPPMDPVTEMSELVLGSPIQAYEDQDHGAHMAVHQSIFSTFSEEDQEIYGSSYSAHMAEHKAFDIKLAFEELIGTAITPENQEMVTQQAAQAAQIYAAENAQQGPDNEDEAFKKEQARKDAETMAGIKRKDTEASAQIKRENDRVAGQIETEAMRGLKESLTKGAAMMGLDNDGE